MTRPGRTALWILGILAGLFLLLYALANFWLFESIIHVFFGWVSHALKVLPKVAVNWSGVGMMAACVALSGFFGHGFCRWLWQANGRTEPWRLRWTVAGLTLIVVMFGAGMAFTAVAHQTGWLMRSREPLLESSGSNTRNAWISLKTIHSAQVDFRANDRDVNEKQDFWRKDIAGLYLLKNPGGYEIKLIELSIASADAKPALQFEDPKTWSNKAGYWYQALGFRNETTPDPDRFAALAYPETPDEGIWYYIISHAGVIYRRHIDAGPKPDVYPDDPVKEGWSKLD